MLFDTFDRTGNAEFPFPKRVVFKAVYTALTQLSGMSIESYDTLAARVDVKTGMSAFSWGETVSINVTANGSSAAVVCIQSASKTVFGSATTHGKNRQNVRNIISQTSRLLSEFGSVWMEEMGLTPPPLSTPTETSANLVADELTKLADLHARGILTAEEFREQKAKLLNR